MELTAIEELLRRTIGLDAASIGSATIERVVRERLRACRLNDLQDYRQHLHESGTELQALIEAVVVPETWFFRDREAFAALARLATGNWLCTHPQGVLRLLSLPCSTGEEAYSMAMALLDAGFPAHRFHIDAMDISARALETARHAVYGRNSFRGHDLGFRDRHFEATAQGHQPMAAVRRNVRFQQGNILAPDGLSGAEIYDVILCRNLLIYLDAAGQELAITMLSRVLTKEGVLFVGSSETSIPVRHGFASMKLPMAFAFRKADASAKPIAPPVPPSVRRRATPFVRLPVAALSAPRPAARPPVRRPDRPPEPRTGPEDRIAEASRLADQGKLDTALALCEEQLRIQGPTAQVFHLMGLLHDATGNRQDAAHCYRKALYLEPDHYETLLHLAALLEKQGDPASARQLYERTKRLRARSLN